MAPYSIDIMRKVFITILDTKDTLSSIHITYKVICILTNEYLYKQFCSGVKIACVLMKPYDT